MRRVLRQRGYCERADPWWPAGARRLPAWRPTVRRTFAKRPIARAPQPVAFAPRAVRRTRRQTAARPCGAREVRAAARAVVLGAERDWRDAPKRFPPARCNRQPRVSI